MTTIKTWQERVYKPGWAEKDMVAMVDEISDLRTALAERDAEIERLRSLLKEARKIIRASSSRNLAKDWDERATAALKGTP